MARTKKTSPKINNEIQELLSRLEVDLVGVAHVDDVKGTRLAEQATGLLPSVKSIVTLGMEIWPEFLDLTTTERTAGATNPNDLYQRHIEYLRGRLVRAAYDIAKASHRAGLKALPLPAQGPATDSRFLEGIISYKHAGEAAGLGRFGMNSLLVTTEYGPRVYLTVCLTEAELKSTANPELQTCRFCNVCVGKCPAHALSRPQDGQPYAINKFACRTYIDATGSCCECMSQCPVANPRYD